ncbi:cell division transport system ATP-binding protein [Paucidesulfovibrio gracilis DSM 16080]|uniref:Cell division ATP-binding protein FtsE n=1 Tax=Paucidesulfovibrio gracilis DSM 16080 TaxID=1121449 RepID=A0A1T4XPF4_9BACT|nr:cell division ATP-binding protein FtsE [Paucidesulfovibrio gracilis]SKA91454.1 cell division transport system ATP-binding protein [Paucidesulfovibrio gracilis DSM 16080]
MVEFKRVSHVFGSSWALKDVSFALDKGGFLFLTGHSGAGKTTLLRLMYAGLPLKRGHASVAGFDLRKLRRGHVPELRRRVSVIFQDFKILAQRSVFDNVALALEVRGVSRQHLERRVRAIVRALGLENKSYTRCGHLSGGEQQRVAIARSMVVNPKLILADEPTGNLDADLSTDLINIFKQFNSYGTTVIMATHNRHILDMVPDAHVLHLENGQVTETTLPNQAPAEPGGLL